MAFKSSRSMVGRAFFLYSSGGNFNYFLDRDVVSAKGNETKILRARLNWQEAARQGHEGYNNDLRLMVRPWGFDLENMDANSIRWYHGTIDTNVSHDAARKTAEIANRYKRNIDFRAYDGLDHGTIQSEKICECLNWMLK
ncbi:hypothetical protein GT037_001359 [Alternaria burnsii]|uniref:Uncharacterized protein n=1 Tax=Alternaria burnsii TaxID=1187904 RepID=A0A8H7BJ11_9PLEO|nr:uncharacterized protein GT037_001359 [Alternaria burnsii]KAF7682383.1 hypothetical protein GT037_001359 [Alternaria burnsii]